MPTSRRWKRLLLLGTATTTLAVILWAAYLFTAIWLRVRCARELAEQAVPLPEITMNEQLQASESEDWNNHSEANHLFANVLWDFASRSHGALHRLEALQRPNVATVLRHLLGRDRDESNADIQRVQSIAFSPQGQVLAASGSNTAPVLLWDAETRASQTGNVTVNGTVSSGAVTSGQVLAKLVVWDPPADFQCFSVTDSNGEKVLIVTRPLPQEPGYEPTTGLPPPHELLLIDTAGRIFARRPCPGGGLVGKLAEPHGKADQLVFGTRSYVIDKNGVLVLTVVGPGVVCIVEDGELKTVQSIPISEPK